MAIRDRMCAKILEQKKREEKKKCSSGWFRSIDLWVMGPARFHCATLLRYLLLYLKNKYSLKKSADYGIQFRDRNQNKPPKNVKKLAPNKGLEPLTLRLKV